MISPAKAARVGAASLLLKEVGGRRGLRRHVRRHRHHLWDRETASAAALLPMMMMIRIPRRSAVAGVVPAAAAAAAISVTPLVVAAAIAVVVAFAVPFTVISSCVAAASAGSFGVVVAVSARLSTSAALSKSDVLAFTAQHLSPPFDVFDEAAERGDGVVAGHSSPKVFGEIPYFPEKDLVDDVWFVERGRGS